MALRDVSLLNFPFLGTQIIPLDLFSLFYVSTVTTTTTLTDLSNMSGDADVADKKVKKSKKGKKSAEEGEGDAQADMSPESSANLEKLKVS